MTAAFFFKKAVFWGSVVAPRRNNIPPKIGLKLSTWLSIFCPLIFSGGRMDKMPRPLCGWDCPWMLSSNYLLKRDN
jgi:hypothetical protein